MTVFLKTNFVLLSGIILTTAVSQFAFAQSSAPLAGLYACEAITSTQAQLTCFRTETAKLRAAETNGEVVAVDKSELENIKKAEVKKAKNADKEPKERSIAIRSVSKFGPHRFVRFTLENGEVWQQTESASVRLGKASPDMLTIKRSSFGSYRGRVNDKAPTIRLKRVK